jgi:multidrug resistance efflux pump
MQWNRYRKLRSTSVFFQSRICTASAKANTAAKTTNTMPAEGLKQQYAMTETTAAQSIEAVDAARAFLICVLRSAFVLIS